MNLDPIDGLPANYIMFSSDYELNNLEKKVESEKKNNTGWYLIGISIFLLWPLAIVGIVMLINRSNNVKNIEKQIQLRKDLITSHNLRYSSTLQSEPAAV